jgi:hypothetical protein
MNGSLTCPHCNEAFELEDHDFPEEDDSMHISNKTKRNPNESINTNQEDS